MAGQRSWPVSPAARSSRRRSHGSPRRRSSWSGSAAAAASHGIRCHPHPACLPALAPPPGGLLQAAKRSKLYDDGLHLTPGGYQTLADLIFARLGKLIK
jgi:lysophospholipase L1-like esterase